MKHKKFDYSKHSLFIFISVLLICGFILGLFLSKYIDINDTFSINNYLSVLINDADAKEYFISQFMIGTFSIFTVVLFGTSLFGIPLISFLIYTKGAQIGFSCALFIISYSFKGILGILIVFIPQTLIDLLSFYMITHFCLLFSLNLVHCSISTSMIPIKTRINKLLNILILCFLLIILSSYLKSTLGIQLIKIFEKL